MTQDDSEWINDLFAATACDWTPASAHHAACVLYAPVSRDPEASTRCASVLPEAERQRAETERLRAEEESRSARQLRRRAVYLGLAGSNTAQGVFYATGSQAVTLGGFLDTPVDVAPVEPLPRTHRRLPNFRPPTGRGFGREP